MEKTEQTGLHPIEMYNEMACCMAYCVGATYDNVEEIANGFTGIEVLDCFELIRERLKDYIKE